MTEHLNKNTVWFQVNLKISGWKIYPRLTISDNSSAPENHHIFKSFWTTISPFCEIKKWPSLSHIYIYLFPLHILIIFISEKLTWIPKASNANQKNENIFKCPGRTIFWIQTKSVYIYVIQFYIYYFLLFYIYLLNFKKNTHLKTAERFPKKSSKNNRNRKNFQTG